MTITKFLSLQTTLLAILMFVMDNVRAQDPGFFLNEWQGKTAEIPACDSSGKPAGKATVYITADKDSVTGKVPQYIYGNNAVTWDANVLNSASFMEDVKNLNPHVLRWPGGNLSNNYFWNVSYGNRPDDIPADIGPWYGMDTPDWNMSVDEYYSLLEHTNSTGIICVNYSYARYGTGPDPVAKAAHMAAEWVRYDKGRSKYWEIGNENFGNWQTGYQIDVSKNQDGQPEYISGKLYGQHCRVFIDSMRAAAAETGVDIKIGVNAYDAETSWDPIQTDWNEGMMPEVGDLADFLVVHSYFTPYNQDSDVSTILNSHDVPGEIMETMINDMAEAGKPMLPVAMTEWNIFAVGSRQQVSYINGMLSALVLGEFVEEGYGLGTRWDLVNGWNNGDDHGMFSTGGEPGVDQYNPRPVFFYMYYFQKYFGDKMVHATVSGNPDIVTRASSYTSGETGLVIINKSNHSEIAEITFENEIPGKRYYYHVLTGGNDNGDFSRKVFINGLGTDEEGGGPDDYESIRAFSSGTDGGIKIDLPPLSVVYLMVDKTAPLEYLSSRIDTNNMIIRVNFTDKIILPDNPSGFSVSLNGQGPAGIAAIETNPDQGNQLFIYLDREMKYDDTLKISYSGSEIVSPEGTILPGFSDMVVQNSIPAPPPEILSAMVTDSGKIITVVFDKMMNKIDNPDLFRVMVNEAEMAVDSIVTQGDSVYFILSGYTEFLNEVALNYWGSTVTSKDSGVLGPIENLPVKNPAAQYILKIRDVFNFEPGDVFHYIDFSYWTSPVGFGDDSYATKGDRITIKDKYYSENRDTLFYSRDVEGYIHNYHPYLEEIENSFFSYSDTIFYTDLDSTIFHYIFMKHYPDVIPEPYDLETSDSIMGYSQALCNIRTNGYHNYSWNADHFEYGKNIGAVKLYRAAEECNCLLTDYNLVYYQTSRDTCGTPDTFTGVEQPGKNRLFNFYPNPAGDHIHIESSGGYFQYRLEIFSMQGQPVLTKDYSGNILNLDISALSTGVYLIRFTFRDKVQNGTFIKR